MLNTIVLLISRDVKLAKSVEKVLESIPQLRLDLAHSYTEAASYLRHTQAALVLAHLYDNQDSDAVAEIVRSQAASQRQTPVVAIGEPILAAQGLALLRQGVADYLERPLDIARLTYLLDTLTLKSRYKAAAAVAQPAIADDFLYAPQEAMGRVMDQVTRVAAVGTNILIQGETGTGKTRLARVIHDLSPRRNQPFLVVNCAALSASLIESELFGHVKGAFTGADRDRTGKLADAGQGTLLLDEINSLPIELQAKLLRAVEERVFEPVGSNQSIPLQARLIAASNRSLEDEVDAGRFRSDLFFRLNVVTFDVPALRDQPLILPAMVDRFVKQFAQLAERDISGVTAEAITALRSYDWPGNIRELRNAIERAVALRTSGLIELDDLPNAIRNAELTAPVMTELASSLANTRSEAEALYIAGALRRNNNNRVRTAMELGISRMTLYKKLHRYGLFAGSR